MHKLLMILFVSVLFSLQGGAQTEITWMTLEDVEYSRKYIPEEDWYYFFPDFGETVKGLEGTEVYLKGYILPLEPESGYYILSRYPMSACFFCGSGGPESIVELEFSSKFQIFKMDEIVTIKGLLKLNSEDVNKCNYIFEDAVRY